MKLRKLTLSHNPKKSTWDLKVDKTKQVLHRFRTKENATRWRHQESSGKRKADQ